MRTTHSVVCGRRLIALALPAGLTLIAMTALAGCSGKSKPAPGLSNGLTAGWHAFRTSLSWLLAAIGAIAPFAAVIALLGALGYWGRRRLTRRGSPA